LKSFHFWIFNDFFNFYIGGHFEMAASLKNLKAKSTNLCVQFQKDPLYGLRETCRKKLMRKKKVDQ
jgi:hypothetical protein